MKLLKWLNRHWFIALQALAIIMILIVTSGGTNPIQWDVLAFVGSILGGTITWVGVRDTIKHSEDIVDRERKEKLIEAAAVKTRTLDLIDFEVKHISYQYFGIVDAIEQYKHDNTKPYPTLHPNSLERFRSLVDLGIKVDADIYKVLVKFEAKIEIIERRITFLITYQGDQFEKISDQIQEFLTELSEELGQSLQVIRRKRQQYLKLLFPKDDPESFKLL